MTRRIKVIFIIFSILLITLVSLKKLEAHSVELDQNSLISFPMMIFNGKGDITIKGSETDYSLYYQAIEISNILYTRIEETTNNGKTELNRIKAELDELDKECDNLKTIYDEAYKAYKENLDSELTEVELEALKEAYETARTNYQNKVTIYNNKVKEYNAKNDEISAKIKELTPTYIESDWIKTEDRSFSVDLAQFSGDKVFVIWAKLISSDGEISYDETIYTMSGTKEEIKEPDIEVPGIEKNDTSNNVDTDKKDNTVVTGKLPQTGANTAMIFIIIIFLLIVLLCYKKYSNYKDIK